MADAALELTGFGDLVDFAIGVLHAIILELLVGRVVLTFDTNASTDASRRRSVPEAVNVVDAGGAFGVAKVAGAHADDGDGSVGEH